MMHPARERGFTLIELLLVVAIIGILAGLSAPFLLAAKASSGEASAIGSLRSINSGQSSYAMTCGGGNYAAALPPLVSGGYVSPDLVASPKSGYVLVVAAGAGSTAGPNGCGGTATRSAYYATGQPTSTIAGSRSFATNQAGTIWQVRGGPPPTEPFTTTATVSPIQ